jgi:hypothetical protein
VDYFYTATKPRSRGALWSIFAPALIHPTGGETALHTARKMRCKTEDFLATLCHEKGLFSSATTTLRQRSYDTEKKAFPLLSLTQKALNNNRIVRNAG